MLLMGVEVRLLSLAVVEALEPPIPGLAR